MVGEILPNLLNNKSIAGKFVEPFLGGGAVFFAVQPSRAILADINPDLIELYEEIKKHPSKIWEIFREFPPTKEGYYSIRDSSFDHEERSFKAARTLYLNRTCFKGMWRHNSSGEFNVGYGGESRRWVINEETLLEISRLLKNANLVCQDFQKVIELCDAKDFIFLDPPYKPGERELVNSHYVSNKFSFNEHIRLARTLRVASDNNLRWAMTISSHPDIMALYADIEELRVIPLNTGTGNTPGALVRNPGENLIFNYTPNYEEVII